MFLMEGGSIMVNHAPTDRIKNFTQRQYITDLYDIEKKKYVLDMRQKEIEDKIFQLTNPDRNFERSEEYYKARQNLMDYSVKNEPGRRNTLSENLGIIFGPSFCCVIIAFVLDFIVNFVVEYSHAPRNFFLWIALGLSVIGALRALFQDLAAQMRIKKYQDDHDYVNKKNSEEIAYWKAVFDNRLSRYDSHIRNDVLPFYEKELQEVKSNQIKINNLLNSLYSLRINDTLVYHPSYRGLTPVSIIFGYFDTGRVSKFEGYDGAYNLYEDEKMKGMIITKLDEVVKKIGDLENTMYYVQAALSECNTQISQLSNNVTKAIENHSRSSYTIENKLDQIKTNTENAAYYSRLSRDLDIYNSYYRR